MREPSDHFRAYVRLRAEVIDSEDALSELLDEIDKAINDAIKTDRRRIDLSDPADEFAAIESWASVASYPMARLSAPASPWPLYPAGWGRKPLDGFARSLTPYAGVCKGSCQASGRKSFSIGVSFPWGIQISLEWALAS